MKIGTLEVKKIGSKGKTFEEVLAD